MAYVAYPETLLPPPETGPFTRVQGTRASDLEGGPKQYASVERAFRGTQEVTFLFNHTQATAFRTFWKDTLVRGGAKFTTRWPLPSGWFSPLGLRKFISVPRWQHVADGAWRVSATTELLVVESVQPLTLTSLTYPITDYSDIESSLTSRGAPSYSLGEYVEAGESVLSGTIRVALQTYSVTYENVEAGESVLSGIIRTVLISYTVPTESAHSSEYVVSGTIRRALITYDNYAAERIESGSSVLYGVLT